MTEDIQIKRLLPKGNISGIAIGTIALFLFFGIYRS